MTAVPIRVLCVEDNDLVADAIARKVNGDPKFEWLGWVADSRSLIEAATKSPPDVVCMDLNIPGQDTFAMIRSLKDCCPKARVLMLTGHVSAELIDQAIDAGAWGYLSKGEESRAIVDAICRVAAGDFVLGRISQAVYRPPQRSPVSAPAEIQILASAGADGRWNPRSLLRWFRRAHKSGDVQSSSET